MCTLCRRLRLKCDGTRAETRFRPSPKWTRLFKLAGASVQSTTGSRRVGISDSNAGYALFRGSVKSTGYPLQSPVSPFTSPPVRHRVPSHFNGTLLLRNGFRFYAHSMFTYREIAYFILTGCLEMIFISRQFPSKSSTATYAQVAIV